MPHPLGVAPLGCAVQHDVELCERGQVSDAVDDPGGQGAEGGELQTDGQPVTLVHPKVLQQRWGEGGGGKATVSFVPLWSITR